MKREEATPQALFENSQRFAITEFIYVEGRGRYKLTALEARRRGFFGTSYSA